MPYFLYFTKSRRKKSPQGGGEAAERQKDLIGFVRSFCLCALIRGLQNLESPFGKDLILFVRSRHCGELNRGSQNLEKFQKDLILFVRDSCLGADSRFAEPRFSRQGIRLVTFCIVQKVTKKHARTCKKLPVASFCASETAETGRIANGREQGDHVSRRSRVATLWTPGDDSKLCRRRF